MVSYWRRQDRSPRRRNCLGIARRDFRLMPEFLFTPEKAKRSPRNRTPVCYATSDSICRRQSAAASVEISSRRAPILICLGPCPVFFQIIESRATDAVKSAELFDREGSPLLPWGLLLSIALHSR